MEKGLIFYEKQQFRQPWLWVLIVFTTLPAILVTVSEARQNQQDVLVSLLVILLPITVIAIWFWNAALITRIDKEGIYVKFAWFHRKYKFYSWDNIVSYDIKTYSPLTDYGGWGIRKGAYNVSGDVGMLIHFKDGKKLMIGTNDPDGMKKALQQISL